MLNLAIKFRCFMMQNNTLFTRLSFLALTACLLFGYLFSDGEWSIQRLIEGGLLGGLVCGAVAATHRMMHRPQTLHTFNLSALGLFFGLVMTGVINQILSLAVPLIPVAVPPALLSLTQLLVLLTSLYVGVTLTAQAAQQIALSIPFIHFTTQTEKKKVLIVDPSILNDNRLLDLATSGLLDHELILPQFILTELQTHLEGIDEHARVRARRSLDNLKKLEALPTLGLIVDKTDFSEIRDATTKCIRLARSLDGYILTAEMGRIQQSEVDGVRVINIHTLANLLKPLTPTGEHLSIKIQRYGKEARQGVAYLEDGTMVVVNGAADFIGETIRARVLSVKHTSSGRMIFCNVLDESTDSDIPMREEMDLAPKRYFAQ